MKYAVLIAVENFPEGGPPPVPFAESDAVELATLLESQGFDKTRQTLLCGSSATRSLIESRLRRLAKTLQSGDELLLFYAGYAFSEAGQALLSCADSQIEDLVPTSLSFDSLARITRVPGMRRLLLLDAGKAEFMVGIEDIEPGLPAETLKEFTDSSGDVVLTSCSRMEESYPATTLKHRVWSGLLISLLRGEVPEALSETGQLTLAAAQTYLEQEVGRTLRKVLSSRSQQTPQLFGKSAGWVLAELKNVQEQKKQEAERDLGQLRSVKFRAETRGKVKSLSGYQKGQKIPDQINAYAEKLIARLAADDLKEDIEATYNLIRDHMNFKRKDLEAVTEREGNGFIRTPVFDYNISVKIDPEDTSGVIWTREILGIQQPERIGSEEFQKVFGTIFDQLIFEFSGSVDIEDLVDRLEENATPGMKVRCAADAANCTITLDGFRGSILIEKTRLIIQGRQTQSATTLIDQFFFFRRQFRDQPGFSIGELGSAAN